MTLSIRRRLTVLAAGSVVLSLAAAAALYAMGTQLQARLLERAEAETLVETHRMALETRGTPSRWRVEEEVECASGLQWSGVSTLEELRRIDLPDGARDHLLALADDAAVTAVPVATDRGMAIGAIQPLKDGVVAWSWLEVREPELLYLWRLVALAFALLVAGMVGLALHTIGVVRSDGHALRTGLRGLGDDLDVPIPEPRVAVFRDVAAEIRELVGRLTAHRDAERRLQERVAHQDRLSSLGRVAVGVAHEVRNPLAGIKLRLDVLQLRLDEPELRSSLASVGDEITRLDRLVRDLLLFSRAREVERRPTALHDLVDERIGLLAAPLPIQRSGEVEALCDPDDLRRVLDNLLRNAVQAAEREAVVTLGAGPCLEVADDGPGVAEPERLFEPFYTTRPDGTGLGLALSRTLVQAQGGDLVHERREDRTVFRITLEAP